LAPCRPACAEHSRQPLDRASANHVVGRELSASEQRASPRVAQSNTVRVSTPSHAGEHGADRGDESFAPICSAAAQLPSYAPARELLRCNRGQSPRIRRERGHHTASPLTSARPLSFETTSSTCCRQLLAHPVALVESCDAARLERESPRTTLVADLGRDNRLSPPKRQGPLLLPLIAMGVADVAG